MRRPTKWRTIVEAVSREIEAADPAAAGAFYTVRQLAARFGVSTITAKRVFDELKAKGVISPRVGRGTTIVSASRREAVFLVTLTEHLAAFVRHTQSSGFAPALYEGFRSPPFDRLFEVKPIALDFLLRHLDAFSERAVIVTQAALMTRSSRGDVVLDESRVDRLRKIDPILFQVFRPVPGFSQVGIDMAAGIRQAVNRLADGGHVRIAYMTGDAQSLWFESRFRGYLDAIRDRALPFDPELIRITSGLDEREDGAGLEALLNLRAPPTAVVCANDSRAVHLLAACRRRGLVLPRDLSVTGFDDSPESELVSPALTTVHPGDAEMAAAALSLLMDRREGRPRKTALVAIRPRLVCRESDGPAPRNARRRTS